MSVPLPVNENAIDFLSNRWSRTVVQPLLIACLTTSLMTSILINMQASTLGMPWLWLTPVFFFYALISVFTTQWIGSQSQRQVSGGAFRMAELVLLIVLARLLTWLIFWGEMPVNTWRDYILSPILLIDGFFLITLLLIFILWVIATMTASIFNRLGIDVAEATYYSTPVGMRDANSKPVTFNRSAIVSEFFRQWIIGGVVVILMAALSTYSLSEIVGDQGGEVLRTALRADMLFVLLVYFISGFLLLSQARLLALNALWLLEGAARGEMLEKGWHRFSVGLLAAVCFVAAFLPIGSTFAIARILQSFLYVISVIAAAIAYVFLFLGAFLLSLFGLRSGEVTEPPAEFGSTLPPALPPPDAPPPDAGPSVLMSVLFWIVIAVILVESVMFILSISGKSSHQSVIIRLWRGLAMWWQQLMAGLRRQVDDIQHAVRARRARRAIEAEQDGKSKQPFGFIRINSLTPREQIRYFYLSTVRRAQDRGVSRPSSATPKEYVDDLIESWPEAEDHLDTLTEAFEKARYSPKPIDLSEADATKKEWKQVRGSLRRRNRKKDDQ